MYIPRIKTFRLLIFTLVISLFSSCTAKKKVEKQKFISVKSGQFIRNEQPYYFVGTNFWYGAILASEGEGGDRNRLEKELDYLRSIGVDNLRILVGADGKNGVPTKVEPTLQIAPGVYNDTILAGLDYLMDELRERDMLAVLYLNNSWEWSGGYGQYLEWAGHGDIVVPAVDGWPSYYAYAQQFSTSTKAQELFFNHVKYILGRTNQYSGIKYVEDPAIMSWQVGNEPRAFSEEPAVKTAFAAWLKQSTALIRSLDSNHLISIGSEGKHGCEQDIALFEQIHADKNVDYINIHCWPYNWSWAGEETLLEDVEQAKANASAYLEEHFAVARQYQKPVTLEEFGYPRDGFQFIKDSSTQARDIFYQHIFDTIAQAKANNDVFAGCNFWAWGGFATLNTNHNMWMKGDEYTGDPAQEAQGLNSVFSSDKSTIALIKQANNNLK
ncbi:MAG: hypothetical protein ACK5IJ_07650 [Mangrovibacterium sp.]